MFLLKGRGTAGSFYETETWKSSGNILGPTTKREHLDVDGAAGCYGADRPTCEESPGASAQTALSSHSQEQRFMNFVFACVALVDFT